MNRHVARRTCSALALLLSISLAGGTARCATSPPPKSEKADVDKTVAAIRALAEKLDGELEAATESNPALMRKTAHSWDLSGLFDQGTPRCVAVMHVQGSSVREESYYFDKGVLALARVRESWDVDDEEDAPAPTTVREFFIAGESSIRRVVETESEPPTTRTEDTARSAAKLIERARKFSAVLTASGPVETRLEDLEEFPPEPDPPVPKTP